MFGLLVAIAGNISLFPAMSDLESISELQMKLTYLERHISEQDAEFYRLAQRVDALTKLVTSQKSQLDALSGSSAGGGGDMPADEKPPHY